MPKYKLRTMRHNVRNGRHRGIAFNAVIRCDRTPKLLFVTRCAVLATLLAANCCRFEVGAEEGPSFAKSLKFHLAPPKDYRRTLTLYVSSGPLPRAKALSWKDAQKWSCREEKQGWLLYTTVEADAELPAGTPQVAFKRMYLAYRTSPPKNVDGKSDAPLVFMSETVEPHCYWTFERGDPFKRTRLHFHAKASTGDFKGFYLNPGSEVDDKVWSVTLSRERPEEPNEMWQEAP